MRLTRKLGEGARILQINVLDHVIIGRPFGGRPGYFSFKEAGLCEKAPSSGASPLFKPSSRNLEVYHSSPCIET
jgi:hypothetical protein